MQQITWGIDTPSDENYYVTNFKIDGEYSYPTHNHQNHWELVYCAHGELVHTGPHFKRNQQEGELLLIRDEDAHGLRCRKTRYTNLAFRFDWLVRVAELGGYAPLIRSLQHRPSPPVRPIPPDERPALDKEFRELLQLSGTPLGRARFSALLFHLLTPFLSPSERRTAADFVPWVDELTAWAEEQEPLPSLRELYRRSGYTPEHLSRSFRRSLGKSPGAWLREVRLERACALLRHSNMPVGRIAEKTGFTNRQSFHRLFRQSFDASPAEYRSSFGSPYLR